VICTVIGFPNGYNTTAAKVFEAAEAVRNGADEIDMVINIGWLKSGAAQAVEDEIKAVKQAIGEKILKVIIETCLLNETEKIAMCQAVTSAGADFIKTSTGFSTGGATREDIRLLAKHVGENVRVKAAGGIKSIKDAEDFIALGASRLGTSSIVRIVKSHDADGY
jgi:deoxyribose-phosphate aldolase